MKKVLKINVGVCTIGKNQEWLNTTPEIIFKINDESKLSDQKRFKVMLDCQDEKFIPKKIIVDVNKSIEDEFTFDTSFEITGTVVIDQKKLGKRRITITQAKTNESNFITIN